MKNQFLVFLILVFLLGLTPINFSSAQDLSDRLSGRILLQVEGVGQAWYIDPGTKQRAFLGRPADAFQIMRELGLGISENDYESFKISTPKKLSGKILLRVEVKGEAYYVNPTDLKMYYLGRPADAFNIMREKGLGITNEDLNTVPVFQKYKEQTEANTNAINSLNQKVEEQQNKISELENKINTNTSTSTSNCVADTWVCGAWDECSSVGQQARTCNLTSDCQSVNTPSPSISQSCDYSSNNMCTSWAYSNWGTCTNGQQTRTITSSSPANCIGGNPTLTQSCTIQQSACTSWTYSGWSVCQSNETKTRSVISSSPNGCSGGSPTFSESCTYTSPTCTSWTYSNWSVCSQNGQQTRSLVTSSPLNCVGGSPILTQSCSYTPPTCTSWSYSDWGACSSEGQQTRTTISSSPNGCINGSPILTQNCIYTSPCSCSEISKECCTSCVTGDTCGGGILMNKNLNLVAAPADCTTTNTCPIQESIAKNWNLAVTTCQNLSTNNYYNWYLPTLDELSYLYDYRISNVGYAWDSSFMVGSNYWSSTSYDNDTSKAWLKNFGTKEENYQGGNPAVAPKTSAWYVRCVRKFN